MHKKWPTAELTQRVGPQQLTLGLYSHFRKRFIVTSPPSFVTNPSSPLLYLCVWQCRWSAAKLASAAGGVQNQKTNKTVLGKLSWTLQHGPQRAQRRYQETVTCFHLHWTPEPRSLSPPPGHFPSPNDTDNRSFSDGSAVLCPSNVTWWQSRWKHSPPTFPGNAAFKCCSRTAKMNTTDEFLADYTHSM